MVNRDYEDTASAAAAAAELAKQAIAAAQAAAYLANRDSSKTSTNYSLPEPELHPADSTNYNPSHDPAFSSPQYNMDRRASEPGRVFQSKSSNRSHISPIDELIRRHSYNTTNVEEDRNASSRRQSDNISSSAHSDIKFDDSDCDEEIEVEKPPPPERPPPPVPSVGKQNSIHRVHPKLPDYDDLAARFEALKYRKSS